MGFLTPWFLAGVAAVGLPIYVHLLRQYRQKPVPFSSLMFFERRTQSSIKHRRLKYLLLFALRCKTFWKRENEPCVALRVLPLPFDRVPILTAAGGLISSLSVGP